MSFDDPKSSLFFVERAFQETRRQVVRVRHTAPGEFPPTDGLTGIPLAIVTDPIASESVAALREFVAGGGTVAFVMKDRTLAPNIGQLFELTTPVAAEEGSVRNYAMIGHLDFRHPLFAPFADPRFSDFTKIHFWRYRRLDLTSVPDLRVVAAFDNGDPAIVEGTLESLKSKISCI